MDNRLRELLEEQHQYRRDMVARHGHVVVFVQELYERLRALLDVRADQIVPLAVCQCSDRQTGLSLLGPDGILYSNIADVYAFAHDHGLVFEELCHLIAGHSPILHGWRVVPTIERSVDG